MKFSDFNKATIAFFTALGTWGVTAFADNGVTAVEAFGLCGVVVATLGVFQVKNTDFIKRDASGRFTKTDDEG